MACRGSSSSCFSTGLAAVACRGSSSNSSNGLAAVACRGSSSNSSNGLAAVVSLISIDVAPMLSLRPGRHGSSNRSSTRGIPTIGVGGIYDSGNNAVYFQKDGSSPLSGTFFCGDGGAVEEWLQSDNMEKPMFSLSEGPQQSAPTVVALAAAEPAAEAVTGTSNLPRCVVEGCGGNAHVVSGRGIGDSTCSSAGNRRYCFPHCIGGEGGQGARFCRWNSGINGGIDGGTGDQRYCSLSCTN